MTSRVHTGKSVVLDVHYVLGMTPMANGWGSSDVFGLTEQTSSKNGSQVPCYLSDFANS